VFLRIYNMLKTSISSGEIWTGIIHISIQPIPCLRGFRPSLKQAYRQVETENSSSHAAIMAVVWLWDRKSQTFSLWSRTRSMKHVRRCLLMALMRFSASVVDWRSTCCVRWYGVVPRTTVYRAVWVPVLWYRVRACGRISTSLPAETAPHTHGIPMLTR